MSGSEKAALRRAMRAARESFAAEHPDAGERLIQHCPDRLIGARIVAGYQPFRGEIDPGPLLAHFLRSGATLALPVTPPKGSDQPLTFRGWSPGDPLTLGAFGVLEPDPAGPPVTPDLILTPLLAFDGAGRRLGYGAGHFDRTLQVLRARAPVFALGLAYADQQVDQVPTDAHDQTLDAILTETGYIVAKEDF